jgi:outer membrane protein
MISSRLFKTLAAAAALGLAVPAAAQSAPAEPKIGFADLQRIVTQSQTGQAARSQLEKEFGPRLQELKRMNDNLQSAQADLAKNAAALSAAVRSQRESDLAAMGNDFQRRKQEYDEDYQAREREATADFNNKVGIVIRKVAMDQHYDMIFQEAVWFNPAIDITDKIIKELDAADSAAAKSR